MTFFKPKCRSLCSLKEFEKNLLFDSKMTHFYVRISPLKLNESSNFSEILFIEQENFKKSNSFNRNRVSCAVFGLCLFKFEKTLLFNLNMTSFYILVSRNRLSNRSQSLLIDLEHFKKSNL